MAIDPDLVIPDPRKTIHQGCVKPFQTNFYSDCQDDLERFCRRAGLPADVPWAELPEEVKRLVWEGEPGGREDWQRKWYGIARLLRVAGVAHVPDARARLPLALPQLRHVPRLRRLAPPAPRRGCSGSPGAPCPRSRRCRWPRRSASSGSGRCPGKDPASEQLLHEVRGRLRFLVDVGLGYLTLGRQSRTLSGGEAQRVTLATALGGSLTSTLYVLDEPSVGLHPRDAGRLSGVLRRLADAGNAVVVVEHDAALIGAADHVIDLGPGPGREGGEVVYEGPVAGPARRSRARRPAPTSRAASTRPRPAKRRAPDREAAPAHPRRPREQPPGHHRRRSPSACSCA